MGAADVFALGNDLLFAAVERQTVLVLLDYPQRYGDGISADPVRMAKLEVDPVIDAVGREDIGRLAGFSDCDESLVDAAIHLGQAGVYRVIVRRRCARYRIALVPTVQSRSRCRRIRS